MEPFVWQAVGTPPGDPAVGHRGVAVLHFVE
jgi:hypothetical protein